MCVVSMISDHHMQKWPTFPTTNPGIGVINTNPPSPSFPTPQQYAEFQELLRKAREYDRIHSQPECPDPKKVEWLDQLDAFMKTRYGLTPLEK